MLDFKLKIGLVPERRWLADAKTRKGIFAAKYAVENKNHILKYLKENFEDAQTEFVDLEWLNDEGLLSENSDCQKVADYLKAEKVDAIFLINCNFGNEEAAGQIAKMMNVPTLLWGPQDMEIEENGTRHTDAQCGLFAISKQFQRLKVPFTYIENCPVEDEAFKEGFNKFLSVVSIVKNFRDMRVVQVGTRLNLFKSVMANELELTEKFGFNMMTVHLLNFTQKFERIYAEEREQLIKEVAELKAKYDSIENPDEDLIKIMAMVHVYLEIFKETDADVLTSECWTALPAKFGVNCCLAMSILYDMGYIVTCESDIVGAVTQAILFAASRGKKPPLFGEFTCKNPTNKNSELLWHCGPFPVSARKKSEDAVVMAGKPCFCVEDGHYTIARFQGGEGKYYLLGGEFDTCAGPKTIGTYMWAQFKDLAKVEHKLVNGPYIHHMSEIEGSYADVLKEFCKYVPELIYDPIEE